jgi:hypothetical protein
MKKDMFVIGASILLFGITFVQIISAEDILHNENRIFETRSDCQRLWVIGTIKGISDGGFNIIQIKGKYGLFISNGWKGFNAGFIREKTFRIYNSTFHGFKNDKIIIGTAIEQSGPFYA